MWCVVCEPVDDTGPRGANRSALAIMLSDGDRRIEAVRVGLVRRNTKNPDDEFVDRLQAELDKAQECAITLNELDAELREQLLDAERASVGKARERVKAIYGDPKVVPS